MIEYYFVLFIAFMATVLLLGGGIWFAIAGNINASRKPSSEDLKNLQSSWGCVVGQILIVSVGSVFATFGISADTSWLHVAFTALVWPVIWPFLLVQGFAYHSGFLALPVGIAFAVSVAIASAAAIVVASPVVRRIWPTLAVIAFFGSFIFVSSSSFYSNIRRAAEELAPDCITVGSFVNSLAIAGREFQFDLHAYAEKSGVRYAWSYRTLGFYPLPNSVQNSYAKAGAWLSLPYPKCH
jgi:hypothetical protein